MTSWNDLTQKGKNQRIQKIMKNLLLNDKETYLVLNDEITKELENHNYEKIRDRLLSLANALDSHLSQQIKELINKLLQ